MMLTEYAYVCHSIHHCTSDISILIADPVKESLPYIAGQYIEVKLSSKIWLPLSIANAPTNGRLIFHLRHNRTHFLSEQFLQEIQHNNIFTLRGPLGNSILQRAATDNFLLFLAGGTGFAPIKALLETALNEKIHSLHLYWGIHKPEDAYDEPQLKEWQHTHPHFEYTLVLSGDYPLWKGHRGLVHAFCAKNHPFFKDTTVFASGPLAMIQAAHSLFIQQKLIPSQFICDMK